MKKDEIDAVAKAISEVVKPVYKDAVQPGAKEAGKALKTVGGAINVALAPLAAMVYGYDLLKDKLKKGLEKKLSKTNPENIVAPSLQVVGPLLEKYKYTYDNSDLSEMFINLLAKAMDKEELEKAHPSFVGVISELSPDEAKLVKTIAAESVLPKLDITLEVKKKDNGGYIDLYVNFTLLGEKAELSYPNLTPTYLSNLQRLGLISYDIGTLQESYTEEELYVPLKEHALVKGIMQVYTSDDKEVKLVEGKIDVTDFGKLFMSAVTDPMDNANSTASKQNKETV